MKPLEVPLSSVLEVVQFKERHCRGEVLAVGPKATDTRVGDVIQFTDIFKFPHLIDHGQKCLILQEADVCFIEEAA